MGKFISAIIKYRFILAGILVFSIGFFYFFWFGTAPKSSIQITDNKPTPITKNIQPIAIQKKTTPNIAYILFHIDGAVKKPGVYKVKTNIHIYEAIKIAGGLLSVADISKLNLSEIIKNQDKIIIPFALASKDNYNDKKNLSADNDNLLININTASLSALITLPGIGASFAKRIINHRKAKGKFKSKEMIKQVKGIGQKKFKKIKNLICI